MDADTTPTRTPRRRRRLVAGTLAAALVALAIPVSGAFAGSDDPAGTGTDVARPAQSDSHRGDCPEDRQGNNRSGESSGAGVDQSTEL